MLIEALPKDWRTILEAEFSKPYFAELDHFVLNAYQNESVFPALENLFKAFELTPFAEVKALVLGQDPYHTPGMAHGLSFSVPEGQKLPPSLRNIFKEYHSDLGLQPPNSGDLSAWAKQGVLLLNAILTVREKQAASHQKQGWEQFTDALIQALNLRSEPLVFVLWGKFAQNKAQYITSEQHCVLAAPHPSPFSAHRGFFGSAPFSKINHFFEARGAELIDWRLS